MRCWVMSKKESAFISAVVYSCSNSDKLFSFTLELFNELEKHFANYEIVIVDNCNPNIESVKSELTARISASDSITIVHMSEVQSLEACMRAGVDVAVGDFVYEFEGISYDFNTDAMWKAYRKAQEGYDIINAEIKNNSISRTMYYNIFNKFSKSKYDLYAVAFRLVSRRTINRIISLNLDIDWRNAAYANCGLKSESIEYGAKASPKKNRDIFLAIDSFLLYTELPRKVSIWMGAVGVALIVLSIFMASLTAEWTSTVLSVSLCLSSVIIIALLLLSVYYLSLLLRTSDSRKKYLVDGIEKLQRTKG